MARAARGPRGTQPGAALSAQGLWLAQGLEQLLRAGCRGWPVTPGVVFAAVPPAGSSPFETTRRAAALAPAATGSSCGCPSSRSCGGGTVMPAAESLPGVEAAATARGPARQALLTLANHQTTAAVPPSYKPISYPIVAPAAPTDAAGVGAEAGAAAANAVGAAAASARHEEAAVVRRQLYGGGCTNLWSGPLWLLLSSASLPSPPPPLPLPLPPARGAPRVPGVLRGLSAAAVAAAPGISSEVAGCATVQEVQDVVARHRPLMRPLHYAEAVRQLGLLTYGSRSDTRRAARRLAAECTTAALATTGSGGDGGSRSSGAGMDVLKVLLRGWGWVRKPPPELLARILEALVPGSSAAGVGSSRSAGAEQQLLTQGGSVVRQGYGRLHTATLRDVAELVEPLAALDALTSPLLDVLINVAVRRAGNEVPAAVAAAAAAYGRADVTDPRIAQAFLEAAVTRRGGGAAASAAGHVAEALGFCAKAGWYDPRVFAEAADALVARGVGGLTVRQTWSVLRAFAGAQHEHPLLLNALATHAKALDFTRLHGAEAAPGTQAAKAAAAWGAAPANEDLSTLAFRSGSGFNLGSATAAYTADPGEPGGRREGDEKAIDTDAGGQDLFGMYGSTTALRESSSSTRGRELIRELSTLGGLVHGFSTAQVYDLELYDRLAAGAAALLRDATAARLGELPPRALPAALTTLLEGFADVGVYPARLLEAMCAQQEGWTRSLSVAQVSSLMRALAQLRFRDEALMDRLDLAAAVFLENAVSVTAAAAASGSGGGGGGPQAAASRGSDVRAVAARTGAAAAGQTAAAAAAPDVSWVPSFLDAACRQLSYPCPRAVAALAAAAAVRQLDGHGNAVLRVLSKDERKKGIRRKAAGTVLSRLRLLLLLAAPPLPLDGCASGVVDVLSAKWVCELMGGLACSGTRLSDEEELDLARALAWSIEYDTGAAPAAADAARDAAAAVAAGRCDGTSKGTAMMRPRRRLSGPQAAAALDDAAAVHLFRAVIASQHRWEQREGRAEEDEAEEEEEGWGRGAEDKPQGAGSERASYTREFDIAGSGGGTVVGGGQGGATRGGLEAALHQALTPAVAAALLARAAGAWHAAGLGTAAAALAAAPPPLGGGGGEAAAAAAATATKRLRRGAAADAAPSPLLSELLRSLGLPVFELWVTSDGFFRVARGVVLPGGRKVGVEVLPDEAFAATSGGGGGGAYPVLIGDAAFRARCLATRGWRLVALPVGEWAAAEVAGPAACMVLMRRHSGGM